MILLSKITERNFPDCHLLQREPKTDRKEGNEKRKNHEQDRNQRVSAAASERTAAASLQDLAAIRKKARGERNRLLSENLGRRYVLLIRFLKT